MTHPNTSRTTTSVIVTLFNYEKYVAECLESVLAQKHEVDEVIVVDDGSDDRSADVVQEIARKHSRIQLIQQKNAGQLAAFQRGILASRGDLLFFLDADDTWAPEHVQHMMEAFSKNPEVAFAYTGYARFGEAEGTVSAHARSIHLGQSLLVTLYNRSYLGSITSANVMRRHIAEQLFPVSEEIHRLGRINGDAYLVFGSSLAGAIKYYSRSFNVNYRIHGENNYHGALNGKAERYNQVLKQWQMIEYLRRRLNLPEQVKGELTREFKSIPRPDRRCYKRAVQTLRKMQVPVGQRLSKRLSLLAHYLSAKA